MTIMEVTYRVTHRSLMNKNKSDVAYLVLETMDINETLTKRITYLESLLKEIEKHEHCDAICASRNRRGI